MMFDPANLGQSLQPGDKMTLTFHKGQPKTTPGGSFVDNAQKAGMIPGGAPAGPALVPPTAPLAGPVAGPVASMSGPGPDDDRLALMQAIQARMGGQ